jgi:hypothetical protein
MYLCVRGHVFVCSGYRFCLFLQFWYFILELFRKRGHFLFFLLLIRYYHDFLNIAAYKEATEHSGRHHDLVNSYLCQKWPRIYSICFKHNRSLSSSMTYRRICNRSNTISFTSSLPENLSSSRPITRTYIVGSLLWCLLRFPRKNYVRFVFPRICLECGSYLCILVSNMISIPDDIRVFQQQHDGCHLWGM